MSQETNGASTADLPRIPLSPLKKQLALLAAYLFCVASYTNYSAIAVALPNMMRQFNSIHHLGTLMGINSALSCITIILGGKLGDIYGRKKVGIPFLITFIVAQGLCVISPNIWVLFAAFALMGTSSGFMWGTAIYPLIADVSSTRERPRYTGIAVSSMQIGALIGSLSAGFITDHFGARFVMIIPMFIFVLGIICMQIGYTNKASGQNQPIDKTGFVLLPLSLIPLILGLNLGARIGWFSPPIMVLLITALVSSTLFVFHDLRSGNPIFNFKLFKNNNYRGAVVCKLLIYSFPALTGAYMMMYAQDALGISPTVTGTFATPRTIVALLVPAAVGIWYARNFAKRCKGGLCVAAAFVMLCAASLYLTRFFSFTLPFFYAATTLAALGEAFSTVALLTLAQNSLPREFLGFSSASMTFFATISGSLYMAIFSIILHGSSGGIGQAFPGMTLVSLTTAILSVVFLLSTVKIKEGRPA